MTLKGKRAFITGGAGGIGLGIAEKLAAAGADIALVDIRPADEVDKTAQALANKHGVRGMAASGDLTNDADIERVVAEVNAAFGGVDILVNNAGIQHVAPLEEFPLAKWDQIIALNLTAAFRVTRLLFAAMKEQKSGCILNIASAHGLAASPYKSAYVAAKHGIIGLTKVTALEGADFGITCNAICPGYVHTPLVDKQIDDQAKAYGIPRERVIDEVILAPQPMKRFTTVEEIGDMSVFLAGPSAGTITGAALTMDGGWTAR